MVIRSQVFGYIDRSGNCVIRPQFDDAASFSEGLAAVEKDGKHGYVRLDGSIAVPCRFEEACPFRAGLAAVKIDGQWKFIDASGQVAIAGPYVDAASFSEGRALVKQKKTPALPISIVRATRSAGITRMPANRSKKIWLQYLCTPDSGGSGGDISIVTANYK